MSHQAFISHSSKDRQVAQAACDALENAGVRCWIAPRDIPPGASWPAAILDGIGRARVLILLLSASANGSPQVRREVERAANRGVPVLAVRVEDVTPASDLEYFLSTPQWLDAVDPTLERDPERLVNAVRRLLAETPAAGPAGDAKSQAPHAGPAVSETPATSERPRAATAGEASRRRRRTLATAAAGIVVVAVAFALGVAWWLRPDAPPRGKGTAGAVDPSAGGRTAAGRDDDGRDGGPPVGTTLPGPQGVLAETDPAAGPQVTPAGIPAIKPVPDRLKATAAAAALVVAYEQHPPAPAADAAAPRPRMLVDVLARRDREPAFAPLADDAPLASDRDEYALAVQALTAGYLYVFQVDSRHRTDWLFPSNPASRFSGGANPVTAGQVVAIPAPADAAAGAAGNAAAPPEILTLDRNTGYEHVYFVFSATRWEALEEALARPTPKVRGGPDPAQTGQTHAASLWGGETTRLSSSKSIRERCLRSNPLAHARESIRLIHCPTFDRFNGLLR